MVTVANIHLRHSYLNCTCHQDGENMATKVEGAAACLDTNTEAVLHQFDRVVCLTDSGPYFGTVFSIYSGTDGTVDVKFVSVFTNIPVFSSPVVCLCHTLGFICR